jgi:serine/threonine protein kinase
LIALINVLIVVGMMIQNYIPDDLPAPTEEKDQVQNRSYSMDPTDYDLGPVIGKDWYWELGFGSSAIVFLATYKPEGRLVAIKEMDLEQCDINRIDTQLEELRREISVMSLSKHKNILKVLASFVVKDKLWIVTPYLACGIFSNY